MIGVLIVSHGNYATSMLEAFELIAGKQEHVATIGLYHGDSIIDLKTRIEKAIEELDNGDGVIGFVDFQGGSPYNTMLPILDKRSFPCIAGVNMPMLIETLSSRETINDKEELVKNCLYQGKEGIIDLRIVLRDMNASSNDENQEF